MLRAILSLALLPGLATAADPDPDPDDGKPVFAAGSYGRVQISSDLEGGGGDRFNISTYGPRLELPPYLELDLAWRATLPDEASFEVMITPAISGDLFHYTGQWGDGLALRNLYVEAANFAGNAPVSLWAGSRMYRGDDIYLLDFWPMDELNTVGGGAGFTPGRTELRAHVGVNRLVGEDWQLQDIEVQEPGSVDGEVVRALDRQRTIGSVTFAQRIPVGDELTFRVKTYAEIHQIPAGQQLVVDPFAELDTERLPNDDGVLVGAQLSLWGWAPQSFVHVWARLATGLAAYGELAIPVTGLSREYRARSAKSFMLATAGNTETEHFGWVWGAYLQQFSDADGNTYDFDDRWELVVATRPQVYLTDHVALGVELSHQHVRPNGINARSGEFDVADVTKLSLLPAVQTGRGTFTRPRLHLIYTVTLLDDAARAFYSPYDARLFDGAQQFVGIGAEWWINSQRRVTPL
jgi:maltoporin